MRKWLSGIVILGLCAALTGCGIGGNENAIGESSEKKQVAMGRYIEETEAIQDKIDNSIEHYGMENIVKLWENNEERLQAIITDGKFTAYELSDEGEWKELQLGWCQTLNEKYPEINELIFIKEVKNKPNEYVIVVRDDNYKFLAATISDDDIHFNDILKNISYLNGQGIDIDEEGNLYLNNSDLGVIQKISPEGEVEKEINDKGYSVSVLGDKLAVLGFEGINIYNLNDFSLEKTVEGISCRSSSDVIFNNGKDAFFVPLSKGLYRIDQSGEMIEQIIDGNLCALSSDWVNQAIAYKDKFYMIFNDSLEHAVKVNRYTYKADEPSVPDKKLVIWYASGLNVVDDIANIYREQHPDTYVKIENIYEGSDAYYDNGCQVVAEDLDSLNTELLAGKGPDIIVLDGLNYEKYEQQGMFEDLSNCLKEWEEEIPLLDNIVTSYRTEDALYTIPLGFNMVRAFGEQSLIEDGFDFDKLADWQKQTGDKILYPANIDERAMVMLNYYQEQLLQEDGKINKEAMKDYLSRTKEVSVLDQKIQLVFNWREDFSTTCGAREQAIKADITKIGGMKGAQVLAWIEENVPNYKVTKKIAGKENVAEAMTLVAINKNSNNKEGAEEFLRLGLSEKIQDETWHSLPVNENSLQKEIFPEFKKDNPEENVIYVYDSTIKYEGNNLACGSSFKFEYGYKEKMQEFIEDCKTAEVIKPIDESVRKIIYDEVLAYGKDEKSLEQAIESIEKKVNLYLSEQGK